MKSTLIAFRRAPEAARLCRLAMVCGIASALIATPSFGLSLYFTQDGSSENTVNRIDTAGGDRQILVSGLTSPNGVDVDTSGGKVYWSDVNSNTIGRTNLDGSGAPETVLAVGLNSPFDLALDVQRNSLFFVNRGTSEIWRSTLDGDGVGAILSVTLPVYVELDIASEQIYFNYGGSGPTRIGRANYDGSEFQNIISETDVIGGIALDAASGHIYYAMRDTYAIRRANLDGSDSQDLLTGLPEKPLDLAVDPVSGKLYWSFYSGVHRVNLDGSGPIETIVEGLQGSSGTSGVSAIALDLPALPVPEPSTGFLLSCGMLVLTISRNLIRTCPGTCSLPH